MYNFGSTGILTGYIKQLLASFELPTVRIYTKAQADFAARLGYERFDVLETREYLESTDQGQKKDLDNLVLYSTYLKDGRLQEYVDGKWYAVGERNRRGVTNFYPHWHLYDRGMKMLNQTKTFQIKNNVYDTYTHEYLGDYLRFIRDYDDINLMPLYNCFSNKLCTNLKLQIKSPKREAYVSPEAAQSDIKLSSVAARLGVASVESKTISTFNAADSRYKIYMLPVKLFQKYTIAIDSDYPIELCCGLFGVDLDSSEDLAPLSYLTYTKVNSCHFASPFLFDNLLNLTANFEQKRRAEGNINRLVEGSESLDILKALNALSTTAPLLRSQDLQYYRYGHTVEGSNFSYETYDDLIVKKKDFLVKLAQRERDLKLFIKVPANLKSTIVVLEGDYTTWNDSKLNIEQEILGDLKFTRLNKAINHTVLSDEVIASDLDIPLITPLQLLQINSQKQIPFADRLVEYLLGNCITGGNDEPRGNVVLAQELVTKRYATWSTDSVNVYPYKYTPTFSGVWEESLRKLFYQYMITRGDKTTVRDVLGYVDKDVEREYKAKLQTGQILTMSSIELSNDWGK